MPVPTKMADAYRQQLENEIIGRDPSVETQYGPVRDIVIRPAATVFEDQNADVRSVENLQTLADPSAIVASDMDQLAFDNWQIKRLAGTRSTGYVVFRTSVRPLADITVAAGFPVATVRDDSSNVQIQFATTSSATLVAVNAELYFNTATGYYELSVPIRAVDPGSGGKVAAFRITVLQRAISGFTSVTNPTATVGGTDLEDNQSVAERIQIARLGIDISTVYGILGFTRQNFSEVEDLIAVYGTDPLLIRASVDAGAIDVYIKGTVASTDIVESYIYTGADYVLLKQPAMAIASVTNGFVTYIANVDYELNKDTDIYGGSIRAVDALHFIVGGASPALGDVVTVTYQYDALIRDSLQATFDQPINTVIGRDLLFREATRVDIRITADLTVLSGFTPSTVQTNVKSAIMNFVAALKLGDDVQRFDVSAAVLNAVQGVDNLVFTLFDYVGGGGGVADLTINKSEYANIFLADLVINIV